MLGLKHHRVIKPATKQYAGSVVIHTFIDTIISACSAEYMKAQIYLIRTFTTIFVYEKWLSKGLKYF